MDMVVNRVDVNIGVIVSGADREWLVDLAIIISLIAALVCLLIGAIIGGVSARYRACGRTA